MDLATFERLLAPEGMDLLAQIADASPRESDLALGTRLRAQHAPDLVAAAMTQHALRLKAVSKFGADAQHMFFTPDALEQSTRLRVATHRAERLASHGESAVVDLGCGIGGDLIALARAGLHVRGVDLDPVRVAIAQANLNALDLPGTVECADATTVSIANHEVAFIDPARRSARGRTFSTADISPPWDWVTSLLAGRAVAKLMPGLAHDHVPEGVEAEWVSDGGNLVEACLWGAPYATTQRRATALPDGGTLTWQGTQAAVGDVGRFLYEPDDAVIRAGAVAELAEQLGGRLPDPHIAYITTDEHAPTTLAACFEVLDEVPFHTKALKAALRARDAGTLTIKRRGVDVVPEQLIKKLGLKGRSETTLIMTRVDGHGRAFVVQRRT
jgi:SAM-dependent methyltransferase